VFDSKFFSSGETLEIVLTRRESIDVDVFFDLFTLDRNADRDTQIFLQYLYGIDNTSLVFPNEVTDHVGKSI
jgi:hypothetical protein